MQVHCRTEPPAHGEALGRFHCSGRSPCRPPASGRVAQWSPGRPERGGAARRPSLDTRPFPAAVRAGWKGGLAPREPRVSLTPLSPPPEHPLCGLAVEGPPLPCRGRRGAPPRSPASRQSSEALQTSRWGVWETPPWRLLGPRWAGRR